MTLKYCDICGDAYFKGTNVPGLCCKCTREFQKVGVMNND